MKKTTGFVLWFAECAQIGIFNYIAPDEYVWDLKNCEDWKELFEIGYTPEDAVLCMFRCN